MMKKNGVQYYDLCHLHNLPKLEETANRHHLPHIYSNMNKNLNIQPTSKKCHLKTGLYKML